MTLAKSLNCDGRYGAALLAIAAGLLLLAIPSEATRAIFAYDREALSGGQWWRALTAHLVHLDFSHALLNVIGFALVWALYVRAWPVRQWLLVLLVSALAIDAGLWWWQPRVQWYVGASGVLHGLLAAGLIAQWRTERAIALVVAVLFGAKLAWEWRHGALPFAGEMHDVVLPAHRYGAAGGALAATALTLRRSWL
jgi:rhomboid family GlyGly-CTERM serine protease